MEKASSRQARHSERESSSALPAGPALADELSMRPLQAHWHLGLGTLYATTGQREPTRAALATAIALYRALDMSFWLPGGSGAGACRVAGAACLALTVIVIAASLDRPLATHYALRM